MCTVVFIPTQTGCLLASLRDDDPQQPKAIAPSINTSQAVSFLAPSDPFLGGTWGGVNELGSVIMLLRGGFEQHKNQAYSPKNSSLLVAELLTAPLPVVEWNLMDMANVAPFTLIVWSDGLLFQLVWDGTTKHRKRLDARKAHLWSSVVLYDQEAQALRQEAFENWVAMEPPVSKLTLLSFFKSLIDNQNGFIVNRNDGIKTLSYSFVELNNSQNNANMSYYDLLDYTYHNTKITVASNGDYCALPFLSNYQ